MRLFSFYFLVVFSIVLAQVDKHSKSDLSFKNVYKPDLTLEKVDIIINFGKSYLGKPYLFELSDGRQLDCSGFIKYIHEQNGIDLPNSSSSNSLSKNTEKVSLETIKKGDLLFFKGGNIKSKKVGHVSLVISVDGDEIEMMHSCSSGIIIEKFNSNKYYTSRFLFAGRLPYLNSLIINSTESVHNLKKNINEQNEIIVKNDTTDNENLDLENKPKSVKILGVGDIMLGTNFPNNSYLPPNDGKDILKPVKQIINKADVSFGNLEGVLLTGVGTVKSCSDPSVCYAFKMPDHYVKYLVEAGFNLLSLANNHSRDFGNIGTANTVRILKKEGIPHAGLEECPFTTFKKNGITYGLAAFAPNSGTIKINDYDYAKKIISYLNSVCDIVIVSFHGGAEGSTKTHITRKKEIFLGEDRGNPYEFARIVIDAGADIVFGHGPHVTRAIDIYKDRFIAYSLGNFATYGRFNLSGPNGISPIIELDVDTNGKFIKGKIHSIKQTGEGGPVIDKNENALKEIIELTKIDIPECKLNINIDSSITKKLNK
jgi:poly-gamma-glutamate capsule biosynthesis protein CapA/YwtB (metallophosphatase superfamily)